MSGSEPARSPDPRRRIALTAVEVALAVLVVVLDLFVPSLLLLLLAAASLALRRDHPRTLGLLSLARPARAALLILGLTVAWTVLQLSLLMPLAEHATGERQDVSMFADVQGDLGLLLLLLAASWTLGALAEEVAYRGYVFTRVSELLPARAAAAGAVVVTALLFGLAHSEQGVVGVLLTTFDGLFFAWLRLRFGSVWAPVLAHGMNNTIGLTAYFLVGPVYALW